MSIWHIQSGIVVILYKINRKGQIAMSKVQIRLNLEPLMERKGKELGKNRLTQDELAVLAGIQQGTLSRWISNKVDSYNREMLEKLIQVFNCKLEELFEVTIHED
jgi:DNA-binding Xre family transcriptional regulator